MAQSPLLRRHAVSVNRISTVDAGDVSIKLHPPEEEPNVLVNKHHAGIIRQRSRSEPDILGLLEALKMLEEGTLAEDLQSSSPLNKAGQSGKERKTSGGIMVS